MLGGVLAAAGIAAFVLLLVAKDPKPIFGVYREPGPRYWIKYVLFRCLLWLRKARQTTTSLEHKEKALPLSDHPFAFDAVFFIAANSDGVYILAGSERRKHGISNGLFYVLMPGVGLLRSNKLPDTIMFGVREGEFGAEGLRMYPMQPLKKWRVEFQGEMHLKDDPSRRFDVHLDGVWCSDWPAFNFDTDLHPHAIAKMICLEPWTRRFFESLKEVHQTHYEQMGFLEGKLRIGDNTHDLKLMSFRDHSCGKARVWTHLHRYAFFQFFLEDNTRAVVGVICHPISFSL